MYKLSQVNIPCSPLCWEWGNSAEIKAKQPQSQTLKSAVPEAYSGLKVTGGCEELFWFEICDCDVILGFWGANFTQ